MVQKFCVLTSFILHVVQSSNGIWQTNCMSQGNLPINYVQNLCILIIKFPNSIGGIDFKFQPWCKVLSFQFVQIEYGSHCLCSNRFKMDLWCSQFWLGIGQNRNMCIVFMVKINWKWIYGALKFGLEIVKIIICT